MKRLGRFLAKSLALAVGLLVITLASCADLTPTMVPPMTDKLGYSVPNIKGVTLTGIISRKYDLQAQKLKLWGYSVDMTLRATESARSGVMDLLTAVGLGGTMALPAALKRLPKGAKFE